MSDLKERIRLVSLYRLYGELLSGTQKEILSSYLLYDLSIGEIAEEKGVSRAAAFDAIKKGEKKLEGYEKRLHSLEAREKIAARLEKALTGSGEEMRKEILSLKEDIEDGI